MINSAPSAKAARTLSSFFGCYRYSRHAAQKTAATSCRKSTKLRDGAAVMTSEPAVCFPILLEKKNPTSCQNHLRIRAHCETNLAKTD